MVKVLVTGASGLLGRAVLARCQQDGFDVKGLAFSRASGDLEKVDLTDEAATEALVRSFQPDAIIHTAAERRPDVVEKNPDASHALNVDVPAHLARLSAELDPAPLFINISTDYVFDGTKPPYKVDDAPNPLNAYGVSKLEGEMAVTKHGNLGSSTSVRVPVLYGRTAAGQNDESAVNVLLDSIRVPSDLTKKKKMDAYAVRYPTNVEDVARVLVDLVKAYTSSLTTDAPMNVPGILHFSATEAMTKYDMSSIFTRITNALGGHASTDHLDPEYEVDPLAATSRPRHCKLDISVLKGLGVSTDCVPFEDWWRGYIDELETSRREEEERKRVEEEARRKKEEAEEAERKRKEEAEAAERRRKEEEEAAARRKKEEEELAARRKKEEEEAAAERKRREEEEAAAEAERQRQAAAAEARRQAEEAEAAAAAQAQAEEQRRQQSLEEEEARQRAETEQLAAATAQSSDSVMTAQSSDSIVSLRQDASDPQARSVLVKSNSLEGVGGNGTVRQDSNDSSAQYRFSSVASPDPSLSSIRPLRPTPPVTMTSREGSISADEGDFSSQSQGVENGPSDSAITATPGADFASTSAAPATQSGVAGSPLPLEDGFQSNDLSRSAQLKQRQQLPPDAPGFFPVSLALNQADAIGGVPAPVNLRSGSSGIRIDASGAGNDADSDGYGEPSPRVTALSAADEIDSQDVAIGADSRDTVPGSAPAPTHFKAGYGEVPFPPGQRPRLSGTQDAWPSEGQGQRETTEAASRTAGLAASTTLPPKLQFEIRVGDPQKVGDPVTAHIVYTVRTKTTATFFRAQTFSVLRRYSDFRWLHAALTATNPGTFVPPVPEKVKIGRFAPDLVEARRHGLETCINKIAAHPILQMDEDFKLFLESVNFSADVKLRDMRKGPVPTPEQRTYFGWQSSLNGPKFHENDDWFDHQKAYLDGLEAQLKQVVKAFSLLATQRRELAHAVSEYSMMLINLSGSSLSRSMSTCFAGLGELEKRVQELNNVQSDADVRVIGSVIYEYERLVGSIRKAFATRVDAWIAWFKADEETRKVQTKHEKFKKDHRGTGGSHMEHRLQLSLQDVADSESRALTLKRDFDAVTARCKEEMSRFEREKVEDLRTALVRWLDGLIERQEEVVTEWELFSALLTRQTGTNPDPDALLPPPPPPPAQAARASSTANIGVPSIEAPAAATAPSVPETKQESAAEGPTSEMPIPEEKVGKSAESSATAVEAVAAVEPTPATDQEADKAKDTVASESPAAVEPLKKEEEREQAGDKIQDQEMKEEEKEEKEEKEEVQEEAEVQGEEKKMEEGVQEEADAEVQGEEKEEEEGAQEEAEKEEEAQEEQAEEKKEEEVIEPQQRAALEGTGDGEAAVDIESPVVPVEKKAVQDE